MTPATPTQAAATADTPPIVGARYATTAAILILLICCNARITAPVSLAEQVLGGGPWPTMAPLTCLTAALLAGALGFSARDSYRGAHRCLFGILVKSLATLALLLAATRMVAYYLDWNPGLDALQLPRTSAGQSHAATMASATAVGFALCGICLLLNFKPRCARLCEKLAIGALLCSWIGLTRYLFGVAPMPYFNQMAIETAVCLMLLSTGVLALRANYGLTALFVSPGPAGVSARRLMPAAAIAPLLIGALASYFEHLGALDRGRSAALAAIVSGLVFAGLVWISSAQLQRTDTARAASDARFRSLAESLPQLIWTCNAQGRCDYLSKQWTQYTGIAGASDVDAAWMDRVHPQDSAAVRAAWLGAIDSQTDFTCEFRIRRTDGMYRWFSGRASLQKDEQGRATRWYAAATDIEDQKHAQEALLRSRKMESLGTLAGGIAHDFNNILVAISGNTALALEDLPQQHPARVSLLEVQRAGRRAADLVRRILSFSRMEEPRSEVLHLQPVIEEALKLIRPALPAQIQLRVACDSNAPPTVCDATQVHQILMNLSTNAAHAIGLRPGTIEVTLFRKGVAEESGTQSLPAGSYACLQVMDDGCGMNRETLGRIFDPFFTTKKTGTGLGLSMVHGIMKSHGGFVTAYSEPERGTDFRLYFPASDSQPLPKPMTPVSARRQASGQRLLYVDDDEALVILNTRRLTRLGYTVSGETVPGRALERFVSDPAAFDAVITDLSMPGLPGFDLAREMLKVRPDLPVFMVSGFVRPEDQKMAQAMGVRALLLKPQVGEELDELLAALFQRT